MSELMGILTSVTDPFVIALIYTSSLGFKEGLLSHSSPLLACCSHKAFVFGLGSNTMGFLQTSCSENNFEGQILKKS